MSTPPAQYRPHLVLRLSPDGDLYNNGTGRLLHTLEPGEMVKITAGDEYTIIVHRTVNSKPAKIIKLVR